MRRLVFAIACLAPLVAGAQSFRRTVPRFSDGAPVFFVRDGHRRVDARDVALLKRRVTVHLTGVPIADVLDTISTQTRLHIAYSPGLLPAGSRVSLTADGITVVAALTEVLVDAGMDVEVLPGEQLAIVQRDPQPPDPRRLTGHVLDAESSEPIPAALVLVTGTTLATQTNDSGAFAVRLPDNATSLTVRRIGFRQAMVPLAADQTDVTVRLTRDVLRLEQQVVTGLATTISSRNAANAVTVLDSAAINRVPAPTIENAIQGKIAGAIIEQNNGGAPGGGLQIQIRGVTSLFANSSPLYVIDGVIVNNETTDSGLNALDNGAAVGPGGVGPSAQDNSPNRIADINPNDIESIEVLKGSSASAIYGSQAASGVVIITTKRGTPGKPRWDLSQKFGTEFQGNTLALRRFPTLARAEQWAAAHTSIDQHTIDSVYSGYHDPQQTLFGERGLAYETNVSIRGATERNTTNYFVSGMAKYDPGIMINTGYNKQSGRVNFAQQFSSAFQVSANLSYSQSLTRRGFTGNDNIGGSPYAVFSYTPTFFNAAVKYPDGAYVRNPFGNGANVFQNAHGIETPEHVGRFIGGATATLKVLQTAHQTLTLTANGGADEASQRDVVFAPPDLYVERALSLSGVSSIQTANTEYINGSLNAVHVYAPVEQLNLTTSIGVQRDKRSVFNPQGVGQALIAGQNSPTVGTVQTVIFTRTAQNDLSYYAQEQILTLDQRLSITAGITGERSTNNGHINKLYWYPKLAGSFRVPTGGLFGLDDIKLRAAYGVSGTLPLYGVRFSSLVTGIDNGLGGISRGLLLGDAVIRPETNTEIEAGLDATFFKSRLEFNATVYQKRITDLLLQAQITPSSGANSQWINGGQFTNQGIELSLGATPIQIPRGLTWTTHVTYYRNYSRVDALPVPAFDPGLGAGYGDYGGPYGSYWVQVRVPMKGSSGTPGTEVPRFVCPRLQWPPHWKSAKQGWPGGKSHCPGPWMGTLSPCSPSLARHPSGCSWVSTMLKSISVQPGTHAAALLQVLVPPHTMPVSEQ